MSLEMVAETIIACSIYKDSAARKLTMVARDMMKERREITEDPQCFRRQQGRSGVPHRDVRAVVQPHPHQGLLDGNVLGWKAIGKGMGGDITTCVLCYLRPSFFLNRLTSQGASIVTARDSKVARPLFIRLLKKKSSEFY